MARIQPPFLLEGWAEKQKAEEKRSRVAETLGVLGKGYSAHPTHESWRAMLKRCYDPKCNGFHNYGGRGITVCDRWRKSYLAFVQDIGLRPEGMVLDRIDVNGNYEPGNCRWVTRVHSIRNKRNATVPYIEGEPTEARRKRTTAARMAVPENREKRLKQMRDRYYERQKAKLSH